MRGGPRGGRRAGGGDGNRDWPADWRQQRGTNTAGAAWGPGRRQGRSRRAGLSPAGSRGGRRLRDVQVRPGRRGGAPRPAAGPLLHGACGLAPPARPSGSATPRFCAPEIKANARNWAKWEHDRKENHWFSTAMNKSVRLEGGQRSPAQAGGENVDGTREARFSPSVHSLFPWNAQFLNGAAW